MDVELSNEGNLSISEIPEEYVSVIKEEDGTHYKIGIISAEGLSTDNIKLQLTYPINSTEVISFTNIKINDRQIENVTGIGINESTNIVEYRLVGCYPNPFNPTTSIVYEIPEKNKVRIEIYDMLGRKVNSLVNATVPKGRYEIKWNGRDSQGNKLSSGIYIAVMKTGNYQHSIKMNLLK